MSIVFIKKLSTETRSLTSVSSPLRLFHTRCPSRTRSPPPLTTGVRVSLDVILQSTTDHYVAFDYVLFPISFRTPVIKYTLLVPPGETLPLQIRLYSLLQFFTDPFFQDPSSLFTFRDCGLLRSLQILTVPLVTPTVSYSFLFPHPLLQPPSLITVSFDLGPSGTFRYH